MVGFFSASLAYSFIETRGTAEKLALCEYFFDFINNKSVTAGFLLTELPTSSFIEKLERTCAIRVDGEESKNFAVVYEGDPDYDPEMFLTVWCSHNSRIYIFTKADALAATYSNEHQGWKIDNHIVELIRFRNKF